MDGISKDFAVRREVILKFFEPPISKSTFYELVAKGKIAEVRELRGYYRLNESLSRLGLKPVSELPPGRDVKGIGHRELVDLALNLCRPDLFLEPPELMDCALTEDDILEVSSLSRHSPTVIPEQDALGFLAESNQVPFDSIGTPSRRSLPWAFPAPC